MTEGLNTDAHLTNSCSTFIAKAKYLDSYDKHDKYTGQLNIVSKFSSTKAVSLHILNVHARLSSV